MKIIMISDLHIENIQKDKKLLNEYTLDEYKSALVDRINKMYDVINKESILTENLVFLVCGDIIDKGIARNYLMAKRVFQYIKEKSGSHEIEFIIIPGNHDICNNSLRDFDSFCSKYEKENFRYNELDCYSKQISGINFVLANSCLNGNYVNGRLNFNQLEKCVNPYYENILVTHHSVISEDDGDYANIRNIPELLDIIRKNRIQYHLHGHTHACRYFEINNCMSISSGALFLAGKEMGSQFNIINFNDNKITEINNYLYRNDQKKFIRDNIEKNLQSKKKINHMNILQNEGRKNSEYIVRLAGNLDVVKQGIHSLHKDQDAMPLVELVHSEKRIVLIGDAGTGKTYELQNLKYELVEKYHMQSIYVELNTYINQSIEDLIQSFYEGEFNEEIVLIFDGYDEIESKNLNTFVRNIANFSINHPNTHIVISTRNNFYNNISEESGEGTFSGFKEYVLYPLTENDIVEYLTNNGVHYNQFIVEVKKNELVEEMYNPFYLVNLKNIYLINKILPSREELMQKLIKNRFVSDKNKYLNTHDMQEDKKLIFDTLYKLAFSMQCLRKNILSDDEYQDIFSKEERSVVKYSGIWMKTKDDNWKFEHNNFREFLAAKYLSQKQLSEIQNFVTYKDNKNKVKTSWINTLSFLVLIYEGDDLIEWLIQVAPSILVKFEKVRIKSKLRTKILCSILEKYKNKDMWISYDDNNIDDLAVFGQSEESIKYIMKDIYLNKNFRSQSNALQILRNITEFFGTEHEVRKCIFDCLNDDKVRIYEKEIAISVLCNSKLYLETDINFLVKKFNDCDEAEIRYAMYIYIEEKNFQNETVDYLLKGIQLAQKRKVIDIGEKIRLESVLCKLNRELSITKAINYIIFNKIEDIDRVVESLCNNSVALFNDGEKELLKPIQDLFVTSYIEFDDAYVKAAKEFLYKTNSIFCTYSYILDNIDCHELLFVLEDIMDNNCIDNFIDKYVKDQLTDKKIFISYVERCNKNDYRYEDMKKIIYKKDGIDIKDKKVKDYSKLRKNGNQKYFNALFCKEDYEDLILDLSKKCEGINTTYAKVKEIYCNGLDLDYELQKVMYDIGKNDFNDTKIVNFLKQIPDWRAFSMQHIYNEIKNNNKLKINSRQRQYIVDYCLQEIHNVDFYNDFIYKKDCSVSFKWPGVLCIYFGEYFNIKYEKTYLLNMLSVSGFLFENNDKEKRAFCKSIYDNVSKEEIEIRVIENLNNDRIVGALASCYLKYCKENNLNQICNLAMDIVSDIEYPEWIKEEAIETLILFKGEEYIIDNYLDNCDQVLLNIIINKIKKVNNKLVERLIKENNCSNDKLLYLSDIIKMQSSYGLEKFYKIAKEKGTLPDYSYDNNILVLTESIGTISTLDNLHWIIKLSELALEENFKDKDYFGLLTSCSKALKNIAKDNLGQKVIDEIKEEQQGMNNNKRTFSYFNSIICDIEEDYYRKIDVSCDIQEVKKYINNR